MTEYKSRTIHVYLKSEFTSTRKAMAELTPEQIKFADDVYYNAEKNYENGGHWIVEAQTPWEVCNDYTSLVEAEDAWKLVQDHAEDIRNA